MTFTAIVTAHNQDPSRIIGNLIYQTRKPDQIIVLYSGDIGDVGLLGEDFPSILFVPTENRNDWGHEKRALGVGLADGDTLGFFNADDSYDTTYLERMLTHIEDGADAVYCAWNKIPRCSFEPGSSTSGNFIVRTDIARRAGYTDRHYEADGTFIDRVRNLASRVDRVHAILYFHNEVR